MTSVNTNVSQVSGAAPQKTQASGGIHFALFYVVERFFYRIIDFLRHWYVKSVRMYSNFFLDRLGDLDYYLAWKITVQHLFEPLYKDYSIIGYVMGFFLRLFRLLVASAVYVALFCIAFGLYLIWLLVPAYLIAEVIFPYL